MRPFHRVLAGAGVVVVAVLLMASPSAAHTGFDASDPADGSTVDEPVDAISLVFTGPAEPTGPGFQVLEPSGTRREPTEAASTDGTTWVLRFDPPLSGGAVGVSWMVKAPDAHPIDGRFSFTVTAAAPTPTPDQDPSAAVDAAVEAPQAAVAGVDAEDLESFLDTGDDPTETPKRVGAAARLVTLIGTLVGVGALIFAAAVLRGDHRDVRHVLHWVRRAGVLVVVGVSIELVAQLAVEAGGAWSAVWSPPTVGSVVASSFGIAVALRVAGGVALVSGARLDITSATYVPDPVVAVKELVGVGAGDRPGLDPGTETARRDPDSGGGEPFVHPGDHAWIPTVGSSGAVLGAVALVVAYLFDGHTVTEGHRFWTALADIVHVTGGAVWAGGVLVLAAVLWRRHRSGRELRALQLGLRFSVVATVALVAVGVAGIALTVIVLDSPSELWATEWGRTLLAKTFFVATAAAAGGYNHRVLIPRLERSPDDPVLGHRFRMVITGEAAALVAVLVATAFLMGAAS